MGKFRLSKPNITDIILHTGDTFMISHGEWDDYRTSGPYIILRDLDIDKVTKEYLETENNDDPCLFIDYLVDKKFIEDVDIIEWRMGGYHITNDSVYIHKGRIT